MVYDGSSPKPKRPWWQFGLRSLLGFTLLVAIPLAWMRFQIDRQETQDRAIIRFAQRSGGDFGYERRPPESVWLRPFVPSVICSVEVSYGRIGDEDLKLLVGCKELVNVNLEGTKITDAALAHLARVPNLKILILKDTAVTDAGLEHLKRLESLRYLDLTNTKVTSQAVRQFRRQRPGCEITRTHGHISQ